MDYTTTDSGSGAALAIILVLELIFGVAFYVYFSYTMSKIFQKTGTEGWKAWVPIYNSWTTLEIGGYAGFWALLALIPFVNIVSVVFLILAVNNINKGFGKDVTYTLLYVFLPPVWSGILAWGSAQYNPALTVPRYGSNGVGSYPQQYQAPQQYAAPQQPVYGQPQQNPYAAPQNPYGAPQQSAPPVAPQQPYGAPPAPPTSYPAPPAPPTAPPVPPAPPVQ